MSEITPTPRPDRPEHQPRPLVDLMVSIVIPSIVLMKLSADEYLGPSGGLIAALAFPVSWGLFELIKFRKFNFIALLGLISVLLTGGIGLLHLDTRWLAIKEAAIPALIGIVVLISTQTRYPLIKTMLYNPKLVDVDKVGRRLEQNGHTAAFEGRLMTATYWLGGTFFFSSVMNYVLAKWLVTSPSGSAAFNEELGHMTLVSYPMIAIPSMIMTMGIFYYLWHTIHGMTGLSLEEILRIEVEPEKEAEQDKAA